MSTGVKDQPSLKDIVALGKPSIAAMSMFMAAAGYLLAGAGALSTSVYALIGTALVVASANALNMYLERDSDALMPRTKSRPLPAGRMAPFWALFWGIGWGLAGLIVLWFGVNMMTTALAAASLVVYVLVYTPMKSRSHWALVVGAFPGAAPPLMGWTASTGGLETPGLLLFSVVFIWQVPHFIAISLYRKPEYARAGIRAWPLVRGDAAAKRLALAYSTALVPCSVALVSAGVAGWFYLALAAPTSLWFWAVTLRGLTTEVRTEQWARQLFVASLIYLPVLMASLGVDRLLNMVLVP